MLYNKLYTIKRLDNNTNIDYYRDIKILIFNQEAIMKIYSSEVFFTVSKDVLPFFKNGDRDSIWVETLTDNESDILETAQAKLEVYDLDLVDPGVRVNDVIDLSL